MASPLIIPFDNNPASVSVKTTSYTIPSGKFARLIVNLEGSAQFTINGVVALRGVQSTVLSSSLLRVQVKPYESRNIFGTSVPTNQNGLLTNESGSTITNTPAPSAAFTSTTDQKCITQEVWVSSGTVISGSGVFRIIVTEYNAIS
jgi:hypothetical protein